MTNILVVETSSRGDRSIGRLLTQELVSRLRLRDTECAVMVRDLAAHPLPYLGDTEVAAIYAAPAARTPAQREAIRLSDVLVDELLAADIVVIAAPMWNLGLPAVLKSWVDHVVRAGRTFHVGPDGPHGLASGKKAYVVSTRGTEMPEALAPTLDFQERYLRVILGYIGISDVAVIRADGLDHPEIVRAAVARAERQIEDLFALQLSAR